MFQIPDHPNGRVFCASALIAVAALFFAHAVSAQIPCHYEITATIEGPDCGILGQASVTATAINNLGHVTGYYYCPGGNDRPFFWSAEEGLVALTLPPWLTTADPEDINDSDVICGTGTAPDVGQRAFVYDRATGIWTELLPQNPPTGWSGAIAINSNGVVCGWRSLDDGGSPINPYNAFVWSAKAGFTDLGVMNGPKSSALDINDDGLVVGWTGSGGIALNNRAFLFDGGATTIFGPIPDGLTSAAGFVDNVGRIQIGGITQQSPLLGAAYIYEAGKYTQLPPLPGYPTVQMRGMNNTGLVVGNSGNPSVGMTPTVWHNTVPVDIAALVPPGGPNIQYGRAVSDDGVILAHATSYPFTVAVVLTPEYSVSGDTNCDHLVNVHDLLEVINSWGPCDQCAADLSRDGTVNGLDIAIVLANWSS